MRILRGFFKVAFALPLMSAGLFASDRFGYTINLPEKQTVVVITCKDSDKKILKDPGFAGLAQPVSEILAGSIEGFSANRTYLVFLRQSKGRIYCHVDEEPVGDHPVVKEFSFAPTQWKNRFVSKVFGGILNSKELPRKKVELGKGEASIGSARVKIDLGPVPGQPLESWTVRWN